MKVPLCFCFLSAVACVVSATERSPNILLMTADNLGYGDLPCFNPKSPIKAPHLDRLAASGARLTSFYTASPTCSVSRASLLTGRVPQRHGLLEQLPGVSGNYGVGLNQEEVLIPHVLRDAGYATGCFGKWNIGFAKGSRPTERGFDEFFGHASGNIDYYSHIYKGKHDLYDGVEEAHVEGYSTDLFANRAMAFIQRHSKAGKPWFVYLPFNAPHFPDARNKKPNQPNIWQAPDGAFARYDYDPRTRDARQRYHAVVTALDDAIGRVLAVIDEAGQTDRTFVFFYSDNGAFMLRNRGLEVASNAPLRNGGITCFEGGIRVAAIARWPGQIKPRSVIDQPLWSPDLLVTAARLAGAKLPSDRRVDGKDMLPALIAQAESPHKSLYFVFRSQAALRQGDWKIVRARPDEPWQLYNLSDDIGEQRNLADAQPETLTRLKAELVQLARGTERMSYVPVELPPPGRVVRFQPTDNRRAKGISMEHTWTSALAAALRCMTSLAVAEQQPAPGEAGIAWYSRRDTALAEAKRSSQPARFQSASAQCSGVPGVF